MCALDPQRAAYDYWKVGAAGMTADEINALPTYNGGYDAAAEADGTTQAGMNALQTVRDAAIEKWKTDNPERHQAALREQEQAASGQAPSRQAATDARRGAGGSGGGGSSSIGTLLTGGATQGVPQSSLDLSKNTLLGL